MRGFRQNPEAWSVALLAYAAGVIDSDGTIGIRRDTYAMRTRRSDYGPVFKERVSLKQIEPQAVDLFHAQFGGSRFIWTPRRRRAEPMYSWQIVSRMASVLLEAVLPYLRIKRRQRRSAWSYASSMKRVGRSDSHTAAAIVAVVAGPTSIRRR